ncbi:cilia- and flagella-associated protein 61 [Trichonephila inaurata madagascariensis]|uniref:Cilia- and flagella-associated protein 61 n=1 Tax=Trichonephila inaurata madagascariensis TaxID=2747483 RepID=A0A8X7BTR1_9ARAC|nr:cilia- and flagella-associated protein 61 [Trichonephila inaurata madagascariensis]
MTEVKISYTETDDISWITELAKTNILPPFESTNIKELHEFSAWSLVVKESKSSQRTYAAFQSYPHIHYETEHWEQQIRNDTGVQLEGLNTLFLRIIISESTSDLHIKLILQKTFHSIPSLEYCCFVSHEENEPSPALLEFFKNKDSSTERIKLWCCERISILPEVGIRSKRSEDYLSIKNLFSQIYSSLPNSELEIFTLDFLDFGEDRCPTYKYFTYDESNSYIGVADIDEGEAVGFIYATTNRINLDILNNNFQLESVYGLRKRHRKDQIDISFEDASTTVPDFTSEEEDEILEIITDIITTVEMDPDLVQCMRDIIDQISPPESPEIIKVDVKTLKGKDIKTILNSQMFDISNPVHLSLVTKNNFKYFLITSLVRIINSESFDSKNETHMELVLLLGKSITKITNDRLNEILTSEIFDPAEEKFAKISLYVLDKMPSHKLLQFQKSSIGRSIYQKIKVKEALTKRKKKIKVSYAGTQAILHEMARLSRLREKDSNDKSSYPPGSDSQSYPEKADLKNICYRNMGFISSLAVRGKYKIQGNYSLAQVKEPFGFKPSQESLDVVETDTSKNESTEKYPVMHTEGEDKFKIIIPNFYGECNCFFIEHLAIEKEYEPRCLYLIMATFEYFAGVDYCVLLLPYGTKHVPLIRQYFTSIPARPFSVYEKELFVFHRSGFNRTFQARLYTENELPGVQNLIAGSCLKDYILEDLRQSLTDTDKKIKAITLISEDQLLGIALVSEIHESEFIRKYYDIGQRCTLKYHKYGNYGQLLHCVIHPIAKYLSSAFFKELMRLTQKSILYYKIYPSHVIPYNPDYWQSLCNVLDCLVPLKFSKKAPSKPSILLNQQKTEEKSATKIEGINYSLCYASINTVLREKNIISSRIVILGYSDIALGVLEKLIYNRKYRFTNLTIVSKYTIPSELPYDEKCYRFFPIWSDYNQPKLDSMCLPAWVTVVRGKVISIKRNFIHLKETRKYNSETFLIGFDYLVICEDLQFQTKKVEKGQQDEMEKFGKMKYSLLTKLWKYNCKPIKGPSNVFSLNNVEKAAKVLNWLWKYFDRKVEIRDELNSSSRAKTKFKTLQELQMAKREGRIIIYGNCINTYICLTVLLEENFPFSKFTFVKSPTTRNSFDFYTPDIESVVTHMLQKNNLEYYEGLLEYEFRNEEITSVNITTDKDSFRLDCGALLIFNTKSVNYRIFKALHQSDLSFSLPLREGNGYPYLLINTSFQTNVKNVFAAGTITKMCTKNGQSLRFENSRYNLREVGMMIGENIDKLLSKELYISETTLPNLKHPSVTVAKLPHGYIYILVIKPSTQFLKKNDIETDDKSVTPLSLVLGNLKTGAKLIKEPISEANDDPDEVDKNTKEPKKLDDSKEQLKGLGEDTKQLDENSEQLDESIPEKIFPEEPEYFSVSFDRSQRIQRVECFTNKDVNIESLIYIYGVELAQFYKTISIETNKESGEVSFSLTQDWILPLDYFTFYDEETKDEDEVFTKQAYDGFWRPGFPPDLESTINNFLGSFSTVRK